MPIRLLATDLDGTLLTSEGKVSPATQRALCAAHERGVQLALVTGRRYYSAARFLPQIPCPVTIIASNGALIKDAEGITLHRNFLPRELAAEILQAAAPYHPYAVAIYDTARSGQVVMQENAALDGPLGWYSTNSPEILRQVTALHENLSPDLIQLMFGGPPAIIEPLDPLLRAAVGDRVHLAWTKYFTRNISLLDVMNQGCSKGNSLALYAQHLGVAREEVMAVGDNFNDLEMLTYAGQPVLMGNSCAGLARDGWPTTATNDKDGLALAIHTYILNQSS